MELMNGERTAWLESIASRRQDGDFARRVEHEKRVERRRRESLVAPERERLMRQLLASAEIDSDALEQRSRDERAEVRSVMEKQRTAVLEHAPDVVRRYEAAAARGIGAHPLPGADRLTYRSLVTLDTAAEVLTSPTNPDAAYPRFAAHVVTRTPKRNIVKAYAEAATQHVSRRDAPGLPARFYVDYAFRWTADADVAVNAVTFVQPNGMSSVYAGWYPFGTADAIAQVGAGLDVLVTNPSGSGTWVSNGTRDAGPARGAHTDWLDYLAAYDIGPDQDQLTLCDNNFLGIRAGSHVLFSVWVELEVWSDGDAWAVVDFREGDFGINVPAVYVPTFTPEPIPQP